MAHRHEHNYPPYQRVARLIIRSKKADKAATFADRLAADFQHAMKVLQPRHSLSSGGRGRGEGEGVRLLGPAEAPVFRLKGFWRFHFQLQSDSPAALHQLFLTELCAAPPASRVEVSVYMGPPDILQRGVGRSR